MALTAVLLLTTLPSCTPAPSKAGKEATQPEKGNLSTAKKPNAVWAMNLMQRGELDQAFEEASQVLLSNPADPQALYVVAHILKSRGDTSGAISTLESIPAEHLQLGVKSRQELATWLTEEGRWKEAEVLLDSLLEKNAKDQIARRALIQLLNLQGRRYEANKQIERLLAEGLVDRVQLLAMLDPSEPFDTRIIAQAALEKNPTAVLPILTLANYSLFMQDYETAIVEFGKVTASPDAPASAYSNLALCYARTGDWKKLEALFAQFPRDAWRSPNAWLAAGAFYESIENFEAALGAYTNAVQINAVEPEALNALARIFTATGETEAAHQTAERLARSALMRERLKLLARNMDDVESMKLIAEDLQYFGRSHEALFWLAIALKGQEPPPETAAKMQELSNIIAKEQVDLGRTWPALEPWLETSLPPLAGSNATYADTTTDLASESVVTFAEIGHAIGVTFRYDMGPLYNGGFNLYQTNGSGIGVIDFNLDGWPDIYLPQAAGKPLTPEPSRTNALYQNIAGIASDVHAQAKIDNDQWGQGVAVGDYDGDGFPDIFVANIGSNTLWHNQGDGTFERVDVPSLQDKDDAMTISVAMADVNGDGLPDLIEVNYANTREVLERLCGSDDGHVRACAPTEFASADDRVLLNIDAHDFLPINEAWNLPLSGGRGLGLIVGNLDQKAGNDVYIANDMNANHYLMSVPVEQDPAGTASNSVQGPFRLSEQAAMRGLALDGQGRAQASMGLAAGDMDRDGMFDIFVTNFYDEFNVLYRGQRGGMFTDSTALFSLAKTSKQTLGFGTQAVDFDRDGQLDLMVLNGHVDDFRSEGKPFQMKPELLRGTQRGFVDFPTASAGEYFNTAAVARVLATIDWNRDMKIDMIATHLDRETALLENQSRTKNHAIQFELVGTNSDRDATGAVLSVQAGNDKWTLGVVKGNGFQCSNESLLDLGIGNHQRVDVVSVRWPDGQTQNYDNLEADQRYLLIQNIADAVMR